MTSEIENAVSMLNAASDPTRLRILLTLIEGELAVSELARILGQSQPRVSRHTKVLTEAGLLDRRNEGAWVFYACASDEKAKAVIQSCLHLVGENDPQRCSDRATLADIRAERARLAEAYFSSVADKWDEMRLSLFSQNAVEAAILELAGQGPFDLVVDLGTGAGRMLELFADRSSTLEGVDLNIKMLAVARSRLRSAGIAHAQVRQGDITAPLSTGRRADIVLLHQVLHYLDDPERAFAQALRIVSPNGAIIIVDFAPHDREDLRVGHAHRRLGVSRSDIAAWCVVHHAEIAAEILAPADPSEPDRLPVTIWKITPQAHVRRLAQPTFFPSERRLDS